VIRSFAAICDEGSHTCQTAGTCRLCPWE